MADQVVSDQGCSAILNIVKSSGGTWTLKLFATDVTPSQASTASSFTEAAGGGYASKSLTLASSTVSNVGGIDQIAWSAQAFTYSGTLTTNGSVYGFYIVDGSNNLITAQKFAGAQLITGSETPTTITPKIQLSSGTPA
jgi:hypothetical protein